MEKSFAIILVFILVISGFYYCTSRSYKNPATRNDTPETKELPRYLYRLQGKNILSGQHNYGDEFISFGRIIWIR